MDLQRADDAAVSLVDDDDDLGQTALREYAFACAYDGARWRGVTLFRSPDYAAWSQVGVATVPVSWGMVDTAPAAPVTPWTWDDSASLVVSMLDGDVDSATALEVLNGANMAALVGLDGGAEIIQWRDAALGSDGRYTLTGLLRGRRGTEDQIAARSAGDVFILLDANRVQFAAPATEASATRILRAVGLYDTVETAAVTVVKAARGRAEQPYAVCQVAGSRDGSSNLTITWTRRTRVGGEWLDGTGTVPLSEASEAYEVDVLNGPPAVAKTYAADAGTAANAFDGNAATDWIVNSGTLPKTLSVTFAAAQVVSGYGVRARSASASTDSPKDWTLEGWDGAAWVVLDTRASITGWTNGLLRTYSLAAAATYALYRLRVTAGNGGGNCGIAGLELYRGTGGADIAASGYAQVVVRTIAVASASATYSAALQVTDFGAAQPELFLRLHQLSNIVGRGIAAEATL